MQTSDLCAFAERLGDRRREAEVPVAAIVNGGRQNVVVTGFATLSAGVRAQVARAADWCRTTSPRSRSRPP